MVFCDHCAKNVPGVRVSDGPLCCNECGKVLEEFYFSEEPTFEKTSDGQSKLSGRYVRTIQSEYSASRQRTLDRAYDEIKYLSYNLGVDDDNVANQALAFYRIGLEKNFTKGRKSEQVQAACLYIAFRENNKPYLLIDFSNYLRTNVYVLGAVFLQLCKLLRLEEHPIVQKPVDPSLFIYKYTISLLNHRNIHVSETALNIIASMKRDWMQTGRKPSGLCGAALYVSALAHGCKKSKSEIQRIVHVCEATLTKRLVEFENTESASLTIEELNTMAKELEKNPIQIPNGKLSKCTSKDLLCEHKASDAAYFALGLCETCYKDFDKLSGGLSGGLDPPAFQRSERERVAKLHSEESANKSDDLVRATNGACESRQDKIHVSQPESIGANEQLATENGEHDESHREDDMNAKTADESESLSDIDDLEVDGYLHSEQEKHFKKIIWEKMNREYLEEQAAKEAAAAAAKKAFEANFKNCSEDLLAAREFAASTAASVAKSRKEMKQKRAEEAKNLGPPQSAAEAAKQMLRTKRLSSKVNYDRVQSLFDEPVAPENPKKVRFEIPSDNHDYLKSKFEDKIQDDELGSVDGFEDGDMHDMHEDYYGNADEAYDYEDDGYNFDY
ncbi:transcription factor IIIB 60 kDa subunit [Lotus japonicus]|uniref:transcription factor IIIB 60 kDa subunit n=1 Tax=Lotus japonicus TaxID=34305 RepID=UPI00258B0D74|nr:transcription factor IIIB 60 kDa subunit [Lotus japonicus]